MTRLEDGNIKSSFVLVTMLYITVSKRATAPPVFTASSLHRIFKLQFHTFAAGWVGVFARPSRRILKKKKRRKERERGRNKSGTIEEEKVRAVNSERPWWKAKETSCVVDGRRGGHNGSVASPMPSYTFPSSDIICDYYSLCELCSRSDSYGQKGTDRSLVRVRLALR